MFRVHFIVRALQADTGHKRIKIRAGIHVGPVEIEDRDIHGAAVNYAFIEHFQDEARAHITVRRLERVYGPEIVRQEYERFAQSH